jgi:uncharacterized protein YpmB
VKFRTTIILLCVFLVLLAAVLFFDSRGKKAAAAKEKAEKLVEITADDVRKVSLKSGDEFLRFEKEEAGDWLMTEPFQAKADTYEVDSLVRSFADLRFDRIVEESPEDLSVYGIPRKELSLWPKDRTEPVKLLFGMENPLDKSLFAKREDESRVVLLSSYLKTSLDKTAFDFRKKDIFGFERGNVQTIRLRANDVRWAAAREGEGWVFTSPVRALASKSRLDGLLDSLSGLRAAEFVSEDKSSADLRALGLEKPEYEVVLAMPSESRDLVFSLHKAEDKTFAMSSDTNKIVRFEGSLLDDLERQVSDLREKKVTTFYSWEADRVSVRRGDFTLAAVKEKVEGVDKWRLDPPAGGEADGTKIEDFVRKIEGLDAVDFVDSPGDLAAYGLASPEAEIRIRTKGSDEEASEVLILVGKKDADGKFVVVKNEKLDYLFRVDAAFLEDFPGEAKDWQVPPAEGEPEKKDARG